MPFILRCSTLSLTLALAACSGHPGAGDWANTSESERDQKLAKVEVGYDGYAKIFRPKDTEATYRCFWQAVEAQSIQLQCANEPNKAPEDLYFTLTVDKVNRNQATLHTPNKHSVSLRRIEKP